MSSATTLSNSKRAVLRLIGSLDDGFHALLEVRQGLDRILVEQSGSLPPCPALGSQSRKWQSSYRDCLEQSRIKGLKIDIQLSLPQRIQACGRLGEGLSQRFCHWLTDDSFRAIEQSLRELLSPQESVQLLVRTEDPRLHRLPWHQWPLVESYPRLEVAFGSPPKWLERPASPSQKVRILAILGDRSGINIDVDRKLLSSLPQAEVEFLVEPSRAELTKLLWEKSWDILFFAGHSHSTERKGQISVNAHEDLSIEQLRNGLKQAISRGLQLAIFNSCDGLGIAYELEALHLPQLIVMREPVPDQVAQDFLKAFLTAFSQGQELPEALRQAREQLEGLESNYPTATWLPVLFQNSAMLPPTWQSLQKHPEPQIPLWLKLLPPLGIGSVATAISLGLRLSGLLQPMELALFDHFTRTRPAEIPDNRILVVEVTPEDIDAEIRAGENQDGLSISDQRLNRVLDQLNAYNPRFIGLDLYRDLAQETAIQSEQLRQHTQGLEQRMQSMENLVAICKFEVPGDSSAARAKPVAMPDARMAFSNVLRDTDGRVRTHPLGRTPQPQVDSGCLPQYSFSAFLAFSYLEATEATSLTISEQSHIWQWGDLEIVPIRAASGSNLVAASTHYGPYGSMSAAGHLTLLNYRASEQQDSAEGKSPRAAFPSVTIADVLEGRVNKLQIENKIILIGVAPTSGSSDETDYWPTPYYRRNGEVFKMPGVYLQAQMISQILSAAIQKRVLLWALPWYLDALLIGLLAIAFIAVAQPLLKQRWGTQKLGIALFLFGLMLYGGSLVAFMLAGLYLPFVPTAFALLCGSVGLQAWQSLAMSQRLLPTTQPVVQALPA